MALSGLFDAPAVGRLRSALPDVELIAWRELVVDLGDLLAVDRGLLRTLSRTRMRLLVAGSSVRWERVPSGCAAELGTVEAFTVLDEGAAPM